MFSRGSILRIGATSILLWMALLMVALWGWALNVAHVANADFSVLTVKLVLQMIGLVVFPLGAVLGLVL